MLIFVFGEDAYQAKEKVRIMHEAFLQKFDPAGTNACHFPYGDQKKLEFGAIGQAIQSPPFLATKRFILLKGLLGEVTRKADAGAWIELLSAIPESSIVVLLDVLSSDKIRKHSIFSALKGRQDVHEYVFEAMSEQEAIKWVVVEAKKYNLDFPAGLCRDFVVMAGVDVWMLSLELKKLVGYCKGRQVTREDLELMVRPSADDQLFDLMDALSQKQLKRAKTLLDQQRRFGMPDAQLFGMLVRQVRLLLAARDYLDAHPQSGQKEVASGLGVHPYVAKKLIEQSRGFSKDQLRTLQIQMMDWDLAAKTGGLDQAQAADLTVFGLLDTNN